MVSDPFLVGVFFGVVPALGFLYILLHRYEGLFNERRAFLGFFLGLGGGLVATLLQFILGPRSGSLQVFSLYAVLFGLINALIMAMVLNSKRFRGRRDTTFYGLAFGLGFGAFNVLFWVGSTVIRLQNAPGDVLVEVLALSLFGIFFIGAILMHAAVGAWIGRGAAMGGLPTEVLRGATWETLFFVGFYFLFDPTLGPAIPWVGIIAGIALANYVMKHVLDKLVPPEILREMAIHKRRIARDVMREPTTPTGTDPDAARTPGSGPAEGPPPVPPKP